MVSITCISTPHFCNSKKRQGWDFPCLKLSHEKVTMPCCAGYSGTQCGCDRSWDRWDLLSMSRIILWVLCSKTLLAPDLQVEPHMLLTCTGDSPTLPRLCRSHTPGACACHRAFPGRNNLAAAPDLRVHQWGTEEMQKVGKQRHSRRRQNCPGWDSTRAMEVTAARLVVPHRLCWVLP